MLHVKGTICRKIAATVLLSYVRSSFFCLDRAPKDEKVLNKYLTTYFPSTHPEEKKNLPGLGARVFPDAGQYRLRVVPGLTLFI